MRARDEADADVAVKLRDRALGYSHSSEKIFLNRDGEVVRVETIEHYPPDTKAAETWLIIASPLSGSGTVAFQNLVPICAGPAELCVWPTARCSRAGRWPQRPRRPVCLALYPGGG